MKGSVCITGADRGLGLELSKNFLEAGFTVFAGRYLKNWTYLEELKREYPETLVIIELDVSRDESVKNAVLQISAQADSLEVLINNAAIGGGDEDKGTIFDELNFERMLHLFNVNALGALRMSNACINLIMASGRKLIVNISSEAGSIGTCWRYDAFGYCMSKAALNMSSAIIHNRLHREYNGQVLDINPGGMATYLTATRGENDEMLPPPQRSTEITPELSAKRITKLILDHGRFKSDHPGFVNYAGDRIPW